MRSQTQLRPFRRRRRRLRRLSILLAIFVTFNYPARGAEGEPAKKKPAAPGLAQVPTWSKDDLNFFLHGTMSTEVFPEAVLRAFIKTYPDLFPNISADFRRLELTVPRVTLSSLPLRTEANQFGSLEAQVISTWRPSLVRSW